MANLRLELIKRQLYAIYYGYKNQSLLNYVKSFAYQVSNANLSARKLWNNASKMTRNSIAVNDVIEEGFVFQNRNLFLFCNNKNIKVGKK